MSSMVRSSSLFALIAASFAVAVPAHAQQQPGDWDAARANLVARGSGEMAPWIYRWEQLFADGDSRMPFSQYAEFLMANPDFPDELRLRTQAENRLRKEFVSNEALLAYFDRYPPVTNHSRAHYATALMNRDPVAARDMAVKAWRGGEMSDVSEATILGTYNAQLTPADHDARMDALLWQRNPDAAARQLRYVSQDKYPLFQARLNILQGGDGATTAAAARSDPGYLYNRSRELRQDGRGNQAVEMIANRPPLASRPFDQTAWVTEMLAVARIGSAYEAQKIASMIDDAFAPTDVISDMEYKLRDDYTSLMWLGGTRALWERGDGAGAAPLFYRYGAAARTSPTRSKGFYWAGLASDRAGNSAEATRYYEMAAQYADRFYGQMALKALGRGLPSFAGMPNGAPTDAERAAFNAAPVTAAVTEVARDAPWSTGIRFYRAIADNAETLGEHLLVAELARNIGRRDLAVNLADAAIADGHTGFTQIGYPRLQTPQGTNWTMIHALARQESQFAENAISHAGARGLMQFMPATAREEAQKAGVPFSADRLISDPTYSMQLGSNHIERLLRTYNGSYPLAVAAYNAGPGNVNKWLRENGDPRTGQISWAEWIEKIGFFETKNYVHRVLENAVVYENLYPDQAGRTRELSDFLR